jgi:hypothetical protein
MLCVTVSAAAEDSVTALVLVGTAPPLQFAAVSQSPLLVAIHDTALSGGGGDGSATVAAPISPPGGVGCAAARLKDARSSGTDEFISTIQKSIIAALSLRPAPRLQFHDGETPLSHNVSV